MPVYRARGGARQNGPYHDAEAKVNGVLSIRLMRRATDARRGWLKCRLRAAHGSD
jgi:hypothetical protein